MTLLGFVGWGCAMTAAVLLLIARRRDAAGRERIARACHELRGPLHAAGLALHGAGRSARIVAAVEEIRRASLALADLDAAPVGGVVGARRGSVDLRALLTRHVPAWRAVAARHGARLDVVMPAVPVVVIGDPLRLAQAVANLVANAAEHGTGPVGLRLLGGPGTVHVEVSDHGPGPDRSLGTLTRGARRGRGRRGRGLAIVCDIARDHDGRLIAAPGPDGSRMVLELPAPVADLPPAAAEVQPGPRRLHAPAPR